jgi:hypothetical protein
MDNGQQHMDEHRGGDGHMDRGYGHDRGYGRMDRGWGGRYHHHRVCFWRHHHQVCTWR